jgi:hypothetical protein
MHEKHQKSRDVIVSRELGGKWEKETTPLFWTV